MFCCHSCMLHGQNEINRIGGRVRVAKELIEDS